MNSLSLFEDDRKIPKVAINVKVRVKTENQAETNTWNKVFGYIMKKQRTKLEFLAVSELRQLQLSKLTVDDIAPYLDPQDKLELSKIEDCFNTRLTVDIKAFILAILKVPLVVITDLLKNK